MAEHKTIKYAQIKNQDGTLGEEHYFGVDADNVFFDYEENGASYSAKQIIDNYLKFMQSSWFIYRGTETPNPSSRIGLWIDINGND